MKQAQNPVKLMNVVIPSVARTLHESATPGFNARERRVSVEELEKIATYAFLRYKHDAIEREMPEHRVFEGALRKIIDEPERGIPLSIASQTIYEQYKALGMEIPLDYIDKAFERSHPSKQLVEELLAQNPAELTNKMKRKMISINRKKTLNALCDKFIQTFLDDHPQSTLTYRVRYRYFSLNSTPHYKVRIFENKSKWILKRKRELATLIIEDCSSYSIINSITYHDPRFFVSCSKHMEELLKPLAPYFSMNFKKFLDFDKDKLR